MIPTGIGDVAAAAGDRDDFRFWRRDLIGLRTSSVRDAASIRFR